MKTNVSFQLEVTTTAGGEREILNVECEPTAEDVTDALDAVEVGAGVWEFRLVVPSDFDGTESIFKRFARYKLDPIAVYEACDAARAERGEGRRERRSI